jgi:hypothetical protein
MKNPGDNMEVRYVGQTNAQGEPYGYGIMYWDINKGETEIINEAYFHEFSPLGSSLIINNHECIYGEWDAVYKSFNGFAEITNRNGHF